jgi:hypothetical protein
MVKGVVLGIQVPHLAPVLCQALIPRTAPFSVLTLHIILTNEPIHSKAYTLCHVMQVSSFHAFVELILSDI